MGADKETDMQVFDWILDHWGFCAFVIGMFIQVTPQIRLNPLGWLGDKINSKIMKRVETVERMVDDNEKDRIRHEILSFANSCRKKGRHTKDEFDHIITLKGKYDALLKKTGDSNGVFDAEYDFIREIYAKCQRENDFL